MTDTRLSTLLPPSPRVVCGQNHPQRNEVHFLTVLDKHAQSITVIVLPEALWCLLSFIVLKTNPRVQFSPQVMAQLNARYFLKNQRKLSFYIRHVFLYTLKQYSLEEVSGNNVGTF